MLHIYFRETFDYNRQPVILDVERAFRSSDLTGSELERKLMSEIEGGSYLDSSAFVDAFGYKLPISCLSTGCKCALLVANTPDAIIDIIECGNNARDAIIRNIAQGHIVMSYNDVSVFYPGDDDYPIDVCVEGKYHFTSLDRLNFYLDHEFAACSPVDLSLEGVELCTNS